MADDKKHILILPRWYPNKFDIQLGVFIRQQALLLKDDFHIHVIYVHADPDLKEPYLISRNRENGIDEQIVYFRSTSGIFRKAINANLYRKAQRLAFANIDDEINLCHVHVPYRSAFLALDLKKSNVPFVITEHWSGHLTGEYQKKNSIDKRIYQNVLSKATKIACVSNHLARAFEANTGFKPEVISNYIERSGNVMSPVHDEDEIQVLTVSDLSDRIKNISGLLAAFKTACAENSKLRLTIVGGGPDEIMLQKKLLELGLGEFVEMTGRKPNQAVLSDLMNCDFYICNSNFETFGMTVAEALYAGKPVIATKCGGPEEFVHEGNGMLIPINDSQKLSEAILEMAQKFKSYDSQKIANEIESNFGQETIRKKLISFYTI